jgi:catechol 2,3-dioxygenase-like lactoylglutathione lyase family enzyme
MLSLGHFHEISISTENLAESLQFYELMGFRQWPVESVWPHPYAVVGYGSLVLGLHQYRFPSPSITCVESELEHSLQQYKEAGAVIAFEKTGADCFNEFGFRDPAGHMVTLLERATHRAEAVTTTATDTALGRFLAFSLPSAAPEISVAFWQALGAKTTGLIAVMPESWPSILLDAAGLPLAIHDDSLIDKPVLLFQRRGASARTLIESPESARLMVVGD